MDDSKRILNIMKRIITSYLLVVLTSLVLLSSGCGANLVGLSETAKSDDDLADEIIELIVEAIEAKDADTLFSIFSVESLDEMDMELLHERTEELFSVWSGNMVEYDGELSTSKKTKSGNVIRKITGFYDIETTETMCHLLFMSTVQDEGNENAEGISMIVYVTDELFQSEDFYWQYGNREPGIYVDTKMPK
ncbi:MAG: DUF5104 domain-containing protein [Lachnospiraceae bacterium]|nr:DUF5104 domain-containing protein [Lachnospiraceae bacterium]